MIILRKDGELHQGNSAFYGVKFGGRLWPKPKCLLTFLRVCPKLKTPPFQIPFLYLRSTLQVPYKPF